MLACKRTALLQDVCALVHLAIHNFYVSTTTALFIKGSPLMPASIAGDCYGRKRDLFPVPSDKM